MGWEQTILLFVIIFSLLGIVRMAGLKRPKLPGDIEFKEKDFTFVFPFTSAAIITAIIAFIISLLF